MNDQDIDDYNDKIGKHNDEVDKYNAILDEEDMESYDRMRRK